MRLADFETMVRRMSGELPAEFLEGVAEIVVSPRMRPHPGREGIYTLGECIPLPAGADGDLRDIQSRIVLYHGSFAALAREADGFDWHDEAWETLTHELRHHLEWRANQQALEDYDWAAEQNFARHEGEAFDPAFYRSGERIAAGVYKVEDDVFLERDGGRGTGDEVDVMWHGRGYRVVLDPAPVRAVRFVVLDGVAEPPPGDVVLVVRPRARVWDLFRGRRPVVTEVVRVGDG